LPNPKYFLTIYYLKLFSPSALIMQFLNDLNAIQRDAVKATNGPVMIIAGAGSGKTRVLTYRIAYLLHCGVPAYQILALTFTNKAANEMKERIRHLVSEHAADLWIGTFHSLFARILRKECGALGFTRSFSIYDSEDSLRVVKKNMERLNISTQLYPPTLIRTRISNAKNELLNPEQFSRIASDVLDEKTALVYGAYQHTLRQCNAMDFDDLIVQPHELFVRHPTVLEKYAHRFKFILIDEFQDTNKAQYEVTKLLTRKQRNICVVGDDAQSIYSFRGANIRNILGFEADYNDCVTFRLEQNYRSTKSILTAADRLIKHNANQLSKDLWTNNPTGDRLTVLECSDDKDEGYRVAQIVRDEIVQRKIDLSSFAILYRTNAQSRSIEDALRRQGIPYHIVGGTRFYERKEIKDVLAYLRLLANPDDEESMLRIINVPTRGIGDTTLTHVRKFADSISSTVTGALRRVHEIAEISDRAQKNISKFCDLIDKYSSLRSEMSVSELARSLLDELGILRIYKEEGTQESLSRWENIQEVLSAISEFSEGRDNATLESFLEEVALVSDIDTWDGERHAVTLMTLHSSKGLEFPMVVITGLEEGLLPFSSQALSESDVEEERRLLYVGMTRAQTKLYLTLTRTRYRFGDVTFPPASRFLYEIGYENPALVDRSETRKSKEHNLRTPHTEYRSKKHRHSGTPIQRESDGFVTDEMHDDASESQVMLEIAVGAQVEHQFFGNGKVVQLSGRGEQQKAVVRFDDHGVKKLIVKFAGLKLV
jgi:DNA helicase II / ATP-dependent DNA helicase PcrA